MNPIAFQIGPLSIYWYGILITLAFASGYYFTTKNAVRYGISEEALDRVAFPLIVSVLIGARFAVVVTNLSYYISNPLAIFGRGGLGSHGAIIAVLVVGYFLTKREGIRYGTLADAGAPVLPVAHIFVRLGNFMNGELYGPPTNLPWAVKFPTTPVAVHPSQLYEVLASLVILPFALRWTKRPPYPGYAFLRVLLLHSIVRFFLDFIRQHSPLIGPFVLTQLIALGFIVLLAGLIWYLEGKKPANV